MRIYRNKRNEREIAEMLGNCFLLVSNGKYVKAKQSLSGFKVQYGFTKEEIKTILKRMGL